LWNQIFFIPLWSNQNTHHMKTTVTEYTYKSELKNELTRGAYDAKNNGDYTKSRELEKMVETLENDYFSKLERVNVAYSIGSRSYYESVVKIGKKYFNHGRSMTKGRGYWFITEIPEITEQMRADMVADSYYY
jgi:hypothetical protein